MKFFPDEKVELDKKTKKWNKIAIWSLFILSFLLYVFLHPGAFNRILIYYSPSGFGRLLGSSMVPFLLGLVVYQFIGKLIDEPDWNRNRFFKKVIPALVIVVFLNLIIR